MRCDALQKKIILAALIGITIGIIGAIVKFGWEVPFPPRTPLRDVTNPPQEILQQLGFSFDFTHLTYMFNDNPRPLVSFIVHFAFSITFGVLYAVAAEWHPGVKMWQGAMYGLAIWIAFHIVLLPLTGTVPAPWNQPWAEHFSESTGHMFWAWVMELARRDLRSRITREPEPDAPRRRKNDRFLPER